MQAELLTGQPLFPGESDLDQVRLPCSTEAQYGQVQANWSNTKTLLTAIQDYVHHGTTD